MLPTTSGGGVFNVVGQNLGAFSDTSNPIITYYSGYGTKVGQLGLVFGSYTNDAQFESVGSTWVARVGSIQVVETDDRVVDGVSYFSPGEGRLAGSRPQDIEFDIRASLIVNGELQSHVFHITPTITPGRLRDTAGADLATPDSSFAPDATGVDFSFAASPSFDMAYNNGAIVRVTLQSAATTDINQTELITAQYTILKDVDPASYQGSSQSEYIAKSNWDYSWKYFHMREGNDKVIAPANDDRALLFNGGAGRDYFLGGENDDKAYGGTDNDGMKGYLGNDRLYGQSGSDVLKGGYGDDHLYGGLDRDLLTGGDGVDYFAFKKGESNSNNVSADLIMDWNKNKDYIDTTIKGTSGNFGQITSSAATIETARAQAESSSLQNKTFVFVHNPQKDRGFLLADLDHNHTFETGVIIKGAGATSDLHYYDII